MEVNLSCAKEESWNRHKYKMNGEMDMKQKTARVKTDTDCNKLTSGIFSVSV
jgi:hypothetical protein